MRSDWLEGTNLRKLEDLLHSIPSDEGREEVLTLGRRVHEAVSAGRGGGADEARLLEELAERIRWHFRAARYAVPGEQELRQMLRDHFTP